MLPTVISRGELLSFSKMKEGEESSNHTNRKRLDTPWKTSTTTSSSSATTNAAAALSSSLGFIPNKRPKVLSFSALRHDGDEEEDGMTKKEDKREYIYSIQGTTIESSIKIEEKKPLVIPLITTANNNPDAYASGLEARDEPDKEEKEEEEEEVEEEEERIVDSRISQQESMKKKSSSGGPLLSRHLSKDLINAKNDDERFKLDIHSRPEDLSVKSSAYENIPVEEFGAALLRGMGWEDNEKRKGNNQGNNKKEELLKMRPFRLGLGADPKEMEQKMKSGNQQSSSSTAPNVPKKPLVQPIRYPGSFLVGDYVIVQSQESEFYQKRGKAVQTQGVPGLSKIRVQFEGSGEIIDIGKKEIRLLEEKEWKLNPLIFPEQDINEAKAGSTIFYGLKDQDGQGDNQKIITGLVEKEEDNIKSNKSLKDPSKLASEPVVSWVRSGIRVKLISKKVGDGKCYLQKGTIVDVYKQGEATVRFDNAQLIESIKEKYLETVLPSTGQSCIVLVGPYKGESAILMEKHPEDDKAIIQLSESLEVLEISMDHIAARGY